MICTDIDETRWQMQNRKEIQTREAVKKPAPSPSFVEKNLRRKGCCRLTTYPPILQSSILRASLSTISTGFLKYLEQPNAWWVFSYKMLHCTALNHMLRHQERNEMFGKSLFLAHGWSITLNITWVSKLSQRSGSKFCIRGFSWHSITKFTTTNG